MTDFEAADGVPHTPSHQLISVSETQPVDVEVLMKFNTCPRVTAKYSTQLDGK
jgi:hypothetical protein